MSYLETLGVTEDEYNEVMDEACEHFAASQAVEEKE